MLQAARPTLVCLQETKLQDIPDRLAAEFLGGRLSSFFFLPALGVRGGIVLAWDVDHVIAEHLSLREFSLTAYITIRLVNFSFTITVVYGPTEDINKQRFLAELQQSKPPDGQPWLCLGDFNLIYQAQDKINLNLNRRYMGLFRRTLDELDELHLVERPGEPYYVQPHDRHPGP